MEHLEVVAVRKDGEITLTWRNGQEPITIYQAFDPDLTVTSGQLLIQEATGGRYAVPVEDTKRPYFLLVDATGAQFRVAERVLQMEGVVNFRDLGGYLTADGKYRTKWGRLYRSGAHDELTDRDVAYLQSIGLKSVVDYRSTEESSKQPDREVEGVSYFHFRPLPEGSVAEILNIKMTSVEEAIAGLANINRILIQQQCAHDAYENLLKTILLPEMLPTVQHCTAGKDRVGAGSATILMILGVPRETIITDYLLSNENQVKADKLSHSKSQKQIPEEKLKIFQALAMVHLEYIEAFFDEMEKQYGDIETYCKQGLNMTDDDLAKIREMFLEPVV